MAGRSPVPWAAVARRTTKRTFQAATIAMNDDPPPIKV
jgi:hypothetical protein